MSNQEVTTKERYQTSQEILFNIEDIKQYITPEATDKELYFFINIAKSFGLNPFKKEIHFVKYGRQPGQTIVGYEVYIKRAERTGLLDGWSVYIDKDNIGEKAIIQIHRKDRSYPFQWEAYRKEFDKQQSTWRTMPYFMLKKVAISQGFRLAFPNEIGGMPYTFEEMPVNEANVPTENRLQNHTDFQMPTQDQLKLLNHQLQVLGVKDRQGKMRTVNIYLRNKGYEEVESSKDIPRDVMSELINELKSKVEEQAINQHPENKSSEEMDLFEPEGAENPYLENQEDMSPIKS